MVKGFLRLPTAVRDAMTAIHRGQAPDDLKTAVRLYASNTTYRGMTMRTVAEEQIKFVFSQLVSDTIHGIESMKEFLQENFDMDREWLDSRRHRAILRLAAQSGYVTLSGAIQDLERPTYFKEVLAGLSHLLETDPLHLSYRAWEKNIDDLCQTDDLTYSEVELRFPELFQCFKKARAEWFARQARIETDAFNEVGNIGPPVTRSFNSEPIINRPRVMDRILRRHLTARFSQAEQEESFSSMIEEIDNEIAPQDPIFIKRDRIINHCTLRTPLVCADR
jgi:hypothetical protein